MRLRGIGVIACAITIAGCSAGSAKSTDGGPDSAGFDGATVRQDASTGSDGAMPVGTDGSSGQDGSAASDGAIPGGSDGSLGQDGSASSDSAMPGGSDGSSGQDASAASDGGMPGGVDGASGTDASLTPFTCPPGAARATFVSESAPLATIMPWTAFSASVTFANCGQDTWTAVTVATPSGYKLGFDAPRDYDTFGTNRVALPTDVAPGFAVTIPLSMRSGALTGPHPWRWSIVHEGVEWLSESSPLHTVDIEATPGQTTICTGVQADNGGANSASALIQQCVDATASGGTLELPPGIYRMTSEVTIAKPMTLRTAGAAGIAIGCLDPGGPPCAVFRAAPDLDVPRGFLRLGATSQVVIDHIVLDGDRGDRLQSTAAATCASGNNGAGFNAANAGCSGCSFLFSGSARALCGTGFEWRADQATITNSTFRENGDHLTMNMWSDGLTLLQSNGAQVTGCRFVDNSDVDLIFGGGTGAVVQSNTISQTAQPSFAGLMLDNFNAGTSGDFTGTTVSQNSIDCGAQLCDFAIELGPHPWYLSPNLIGGTVSGNSAFGGKFNIDAEGAGTAAAPMTVTQNTFGPGPSSAMFLCGVQNTTPFNVSPDSHVDVGAGPSPTGSIQHHACP